MQLLPVDDIVQITRVDTPPKASAESSKSGKKRGASNYVAPSKKMGTRSNTAAMDIT
jgi:hypothetical protein